MGAALFCFADKLASTNPTKRLKGTGKRQSPRETTTKRGEDMGAMQECRGGREMRIQIAKAPGSKNPTGRRSEADREFK